MARNTPKAEEPEFKFPIVVRKISEIKINPNNPRIVRDKAFQKLVRSIKADPFMMYLRPPIIDETDMILAGNQRYEAWKACGYKTVPCADASGLTPEQKEAVIIKDNVQVGEWDWDVLANTYELPRLQEWGMEVPDFGNTDQDAPAAQAPKGEIIQYNIIFRDKEEYEAFMAFVKELKNAAPDPDILISTLILQEIETWRQARKVPTIS